MTHYSLRRQIQIHAMLSFLVLQCVAVCCRALQCVIVCCMGDSVTHDSLGRQIQIDATLPFLCCSVLQCVAVYDSVLQSAVLRCSELHRVTHNSLFTR